MESYENGIKYYSKYLNERINGGIEVKNDAIPRERFVNYHKDRAYAHIAEFKESKMDKVARAGGKATPAQQISDALLFSFGGLLCLILTVLRYMFFAARWILHRVFLFVADPLVIFDLPLIGSTQERKEDRWNYNILEILRIVAIALTAFTIHRTFDITNGDPAEWIASTFGTESVSGIFLLDFWYSIWWGDSFMGGRHVIAWLLGAPILAFFIVTVRSGFGLTAFFTTLEWVENWKKNYVSLFRTLYSKSYLCYRVKYNNWWLVYNTSGWGKKDETGWVDHTIQIKIVSQRRREKKSAEEALKARRNFLENAVEAKKSAPDFCYPKESVRLNIFDGCRTKEELKNMYELFKHDLNLTPDEENNLSLQQTYEAKAKMLA